MKQPRLKSIIIALVIFVSGFALGKIGGFISSPSPVAASDSSTSCHLATISCKDAGGTYYHEGIEYNAWMVATSVDCKVAGVIKQSDSKAKIFFMKD